MKRPICGDVTNSTHGRQPPALLVKQTPASTPRPRASCSTSATSLRALAIRVASQLKRAGPCSYSDVADALVREGASSIEAMSVRRRVNDALNVLVAAGVATRSPDRVIAWNWVFGADQGVRQACNDVASARARVLAARERRDRMELQVRAFERVVERNLGRAVGSIEGKSDPEGSCDRSNVLRFPFVLVSMAHENASCHATSVDPNRSDVIVSMGSPFQILDDCAVLQRVAELAPISDLPSPMVTWPEVNRLS
jgi:E2F/DP family winged-helix DNA-binding domain/Transcription factor DP